MGRRRVVAVERPSGPDAVLAGELVADHLLELGAAAVAEVDLDGRAHLVADLPAERVAELPWPHRVLEPEPSWVDGWRAGATAVRAGRFVVRPPWVDGPPVDGAPVDGAPVDGATVELVVDPGGAFGSGSHPSTRACLRAVGELVRPGDRVLDVGCGSGVLGLAALAVGASSLVALDVDPEAVRVTRGLLAAEGWSDRAEVSDRAVAEVDGRFDLVLANLLVPVVEELGATLVERTASGGHLVVGGLLPGHRDRALATLAPMVPVAGGVRVDDGWLTLVLTVPT